VCHQHRQRTSHRSQEYTLRTERTPYHEKGSRWPQTSWPHPSDSRWGRWLFKCVLAAKPHQEHVCDINEFVWRFCVNYQLLNLVTWIIAYPSPRCDSAILVEFRKKQFVWLVDAMPGYHQLAVEHASQEKLAFQGPDTIKWTYTVMPFGPTNGPATIISMIYDLNSHWKALAQSVGITVGDDTDTRIIVEKSTTDLPSIFPSFT
jgi:hypothetical protein